MKPEFELDDDAMRDAKHAAGNHWALFLADGNGLLVWKAYREFRLRGLPVHETILCKLDEYAARLLEAGSASEVLRALDVKPRGRDSARVHLSRKERTRRIVSAVARLRDRIGHNKACARVAVEWGTTAGAVKQMWNRWPKGAPNGPASGRRVRSVFELGTPDG